MTEFLKPKYREDKAVAVVAAFLKHSNSLCDKYWLNKVMYYAERQSLLETGQPIFFDTLYSIPLGPIVSIVNDGIDSAQYDIEDSAWSEFFKLRFRNIALIKEPDLSVLSEYELDLIENISKKFKGWGFERMKNFFHNLPEYKETNSRISIEYSEILKSAGLNSAQIKETYDELSYLEELESTLNCG